MKKEIMLKVENISKKYKLGQINGTTLIEELQRKKAKRKNKEDPTKKIGQIDYINNKELLALNNVSFEVNKGERIGIIGHNGAGKSTLLKLISRITTPTTGAIYMNGKVASMLEVGTGFHPELTGRENIYMNGAILGMTKKEIDRKIEDIIEFSECKDFIDTPVKRYSSGMHVKLAFSVAAHLDSEIMIMDEVLAVGDMAFQKKCLDKMNSVSKQQNKTILYVSHNMNTIRELCDRVVVLKKGSIIYDGNVEEGISIYLNESSDYNTHYDYSKKNHINKKSTDKIVIKSLDILNNTNQFSSGEQIKIKINYLSKNIYENVLFRFVYSYYGGNAVATSFTSNELMCEKGNGSVSFDVTTSNLTNGDYKIDITAFQYDRFGNETVLGTACPGFYIVVDNKENNKNLNWLPQQWGVIRLNDSKITKH